MLYFEEAVFDSVESATVTSSQTKGPAGDKWSWTCTVLAVEAGLKRCGCQEGDSKRCILTLGKTMSKVPLTSQIPRGALDLQSHNQAYVQRPCKKVLWSNPSDVGCAIHEETAFFKLLWLHCVYHEFAFRNIHPIGKFPFVILSRALSVEGTVPNQYPALPGKLYKAVAPA